MDAVTCPYGRCETSFVKIRQSLFRNKLGPRNICGLPAGYEGRGSFRTQVTPFPPLSLALFSPRLRLFKRGQSLSKTAENSSTYWQKSPRYVGSLFNECEKFSGAELLRPTWTCTTAA